MFQPDGVKAFQAKGATYLVTANEGDSRDYDGFSEEVVIVAEGEADEDDEIELDADAFTEDEADALEGLTVTNQNGDTDDDGDLDEVYVFGARSFSIWSTDGEQVFDSADQLEQITADAFPTRFNASNTNNSLDNRSDNKGPEPEGVELGDVQGRTYAFVGLERIGGVGVYDVTDPAAPTFVQYVNNRNLEVSTGNPASGDLGPEGLLFIPIEDSPTGEPLLAVSNEVSGTVTVYRVAKTK